MDNTVHFASKTWNELPDHFNQFKRLINTWNGSSCHCSFCACFLYYKIIFTLFALFLYF